MVPQTRHGDEDLMGRNARQRHSVPVSTVLREFQARPTPFAQRYMRALVRYTRNFPLSLGEVRQYPNPMGGPPIRAVGKAGGGVEWAI